MDPSESEEPRLLPGGVPSALPFGRLAVRAAGGRCWDQIGGVYLDFICGYGAVVLGHAHERVNRAIVAQLQRGLLLPGPSPLRDDLESALLSLFSGAERCLFLKTGSEAVAAAVRLARAATGRPHVIRCGFHGWHDNIINPCVSWHQYITDDQEPRRIPGIPPAGTEGLILTWDGEDSRRLDDLLLDQGRHVAALLFDPVQLREPLGPSLQRLRELTRSYSMLLILDESKTALRVHPGGVQGLYGVEPDLTVVGKSLANGLPLSAVLGPAKILDIAGPARIMGTFNGELAAMAAAWETISIMSRPDSTIRLWTLGQRLIDGANAVFTRRGVADRILAVPYRWPCMPYLWFRDRRAEEWRTVFYRRLAQLGVLLLPRHMNYICLSHTEADVDEAIRAIDKFLES